MKLKLSKKGEEGVRFIIDNIKSSGDIYEALCWAKNIVKETEFLYIIAHVKGKYTDEIVGWAESVTGTFDDDWDKLCRTGLVGAPKRIYLVKRNKIAKLCL